MTAIITCVVLLNLFNSCVAAKQSSNREVQDTLLFKAIVTDMEENAQKFNYELHVDPRPIRPDPEIVTLQHIDVIPEKISPDANHGMLNVQDAANIKQGRNDVLKKMGIPTTNIHNHLGCPGPLVPHSEQKKRNVQQFCPETRIREVIAAVPRSGGVFWPQNVDERDATPGTISVRVIMRILSPKGGTESAWDYVFTTSANGVPVLRDKRLLLVVD